MAVGFAQNLNKLFEPKADRDDRFLIVSEVYPTANRLSCIILRWWRGRRCTRLLRRAISP